MSCSKKSFKGLALIKTIILNNLKLSTFLCHDLIMDRKALTFIAKPTNTK